ncbi:TPA: hypothetical protein ACXDAY_002090 [Clostridium botulinum]|uniref:hypothetical protein n=1 Tax=Clostridium botulinum TaxID=1491 RepID=UPI0004ACA7D3|nr:hypothetical protein [Clostridium botulinum]APR02567.1 hypothetical protein RSJ2_4099 [Clostridium botulinum]AUN01610.1 hypothetical protein RSJ19_01125 [Clostridium botulinum]MBN3359329.1 hypothetical protein [Clostridium botulinum]MBN3367158.1 hypothetical protein [Clostridium botulinum]MBN3376605.1 hypothetical protein [Clostridium botulinum]
MGKVINIFDYKKETLTKEEIMEAKADLLYDDDGYLDMFFEEEYNDKIEIEDIDVEAKLARSKELLKSYSLLDMILDSKKRKEVYDYYDRNYESTPEEDKIFNEMRGKYKEED